MATACTEAPDPASWEAVLGPQVTAEQAAPIFPQGQEAVVFAPLSLAKPRAEKTSLAPTTRAPSTPSGHTPPSAKPATKGRTTAEGAKPGHPGPRRPAPTRSDRREDHTPSAGPQGQGPVRPRRPSRTRVMEDLPHDITPVVTEHTIPRSWCPPCRDTVAPIVTDALPRSTLGLRGVALSAWLHDRLGTTLAQITDGFGFHLQFKPSAGGLVSMGHRPRAVPFGGYLEIQAQALDRAVLHADETGRRVEGKSSWWWGFASKDVTDYLIDRRRGSPALTKFVPKEFAGVLVTDFGAASDAVVGAHQQECLPPLLRDLKRAPHDHRPGGDWPASSKRLKRLIRDSLRVSTRRRERSAARFAARRRRREQRWHAPVAHPWEERPARRLVKRWRRHASELFTSLSPPEVPSENHQGERQSRPAVLARKSSYANGSAEGAETQAVLRSVFRTLKHRGHNPVSAVVDAVRVPRQTGKLPPLPRSIAENG